MDRSTTDAPTARVAVWDLPVRLVHWAIVLLVGFSWWTAEQELLDWHYRSGMALFGLVVFRLVWGVIGSSTARFSGFVRGPRAVFHYLRGRSEFVLGHNPLGALSVLALLFMVALQVGLGLFAEDEDGMLSGPLAHLIDENMVETATELHGSSFEVLKWLIVLHVAAILYYQLIRRKNLLGRMISGKAAAPAGTEGMHRAGALRFLVAAAASACAVWWIA